MPIERLWAGWRGEYLDSGTAAGADTSPGGPSEGGLSEGDECVFCRIMASEQPDEQTYVVWRGEASVALLNAYPYTSGHLMVMPVRHVAELDALEPDEGVELWRTLLAAVTAVKAAYSPGGLNVGANVGQAGGAGIPGHLHLHCLPRWNGDTNFMTTVAEARILPEALSVTWSRLRATWPPA
ncbi:MAG: HIT domain-containing protein [Actinomycetota bacterium]|nr:HIT domain-containing protein [Actinomycetota bacterium]